MNQEKIGKFICKMRNEKKLTQSELAERLGVTNKAISKWENGRGMPDYSLFNDLCKELGITVNELLSGEKDNKQKNDNIITEYLDYKKREERKKKYIVLVIVSLIFISTILLLYFVNSYKKINVYKLYGESENFIYEDGLLVLSNINNVMQYGMVRSETIPDEKIVSMKFAYKEDDNFILISSWKNGILIKEDYGYTEMFPLNMKDLIDDLYIIIYYMKDDKVLVEQLKVNYENYITNNHFLIFKEKKISNGTEHSIIDLNKYDFEEAYVESLVNQGFVFTDLHQALGCKNCYYKELKDNEFVGVSMNGKDFFYNNLNEWPTVVVHYYDELSVGLNVSIRTKDKHTNMIYDFTNGHITCNDGFEEYKDIVFYVLDLYKKYTINGLEG